jgi:hypothetical protein
MIVVLLCAGLTGALVATGLAWNWGWSAIASVVFVIILSNGTVAAAAAWRLFRNTKGREQTDPVSDHPSPPPESLIASVFVSRS